jgi:hypothetical protein
LLTCHNFLPSSCKNKINQPNFIGLHISCNNKREMFNSLFLLQTRREMFNSLFLLQRKEGRCSTLCFYYRDKKGDIQLSVFITETRRDMFNSLFLLQTRREMHFQTRPCFPVYSLQWFPPMKSQNWYNCQTTEWGKLSI